MMNKKKIESLEPLISNIDTYPVSVEHLKVERALNFKERRALKKRPVSGRGWMAVLWPRICAEEHLPNLWSASLYFTPDITRIHMEETAWT